MDRFWVHVTVGLAIAFSPVKLAQAQESAKSTPRDPNTYSRPAVPGDTAGPPPGAPPVSTNLLRVFDLIVNNTNPNLKTSDFIGGTETSIAINPNNRNQIVITAFSGAWSTYPSYAPLWYTLDGGLTWTKEFTITQPFGVTGASGCPCDQTFDYGTIFPYNNPNNTVLYGALLTENAANIYSGDIVDPALVNNWAYWTTGSGQPSLPTNQAPTSVGNADQPWLLRTRGPGNPNAQDVYVAYDDFGVSPVGTRVAASLDASGPPQFPSAGDKLVGTSAGAINPGHRLATDPRNGTIWSLHQNCVSNCATLAANPKTIQYLLNRSTDQGTTWTLNGSSTGILVSIGLSTQPQPKFGTVNALLGGVDHAAVDPSTGDLYYVWGSADTNLNNGLLIIRAFDNGSGGVAFDTFHNVFPPTSGVQAALPSVAVTSHGTVGVFYYTYNGIVSGFPQFSTYLAVSTDKGASFTTTPLVTFLSPTTDNGDGRQRVLGDFVQMKAVDNCFYGSFVANRAAFFGSIAIDDPIFFKACYGQSASTHDVTGNGFSDIVWRDTSGNVAIWSMFGSTVLSATGTGNVPNSWSIVGQRDFNGDGFADLLWRDTSGNVAIWLMNSSGAIQSAAVIGNVPTAWSIVGTGDFNGDGKGDILWLDTSGNVAIWLMNGFQILQAGGLGNVGGIWSVAGTADFNGDGNTDILWRDTSGNAAVWLMNGLHISQAGGLGNIANIWSVAGTGDFNDDGKWDILWKDTSGNVAIWLMNGLSVLQAGGLGNVGTNWSVANTGDYSGDGFSDILWRDNTGNTAIWFMNGLQIGSTAGLGNISTTWTIQGVNAD
jgi:hypothetical protein